MHWIGQKVIAFFFLINGRVRILKYNFFLQEKKIHGLLTIVCVDFKMKRNICRILLYALRICYFATFSDKEQKQTLCKLIKNYLTHGQYQN